MMVKVLLIGGQNSDVHHRFVVAYRISSSHHQPVYEMTHMGKRNDLKPNPRGVLAAMADAVYALGLRVLNLISK
jgi:hypothetical protein